jgi:hypothetical protein
MRSEIENESKKLQLRQKSRHISPKKSSQTCRVPQQFWIKAIGVISGAVAGAAGTGVYAVSRNRSASPRSITRFSIALPEGNTINASFASRLAEKGRGTPQAGRPACGNEL